MNCIQSKRQISLVSMPNSKRFRKNQYENGFHETKHENEDNEELDKIAVQNINETRTITVDSTGEHVLIPPFVDLEYGKQMANDPKEKALLWNRLRHGKF